MGICKNKAYGTLLKKNYIWKIIWIFFIITQMLFSQGLSPGDGIRLIVYNITDEVSGDYFVQKDGNIQLPYIGLVYTKDLEFESIQKEIIAKYAAIYRNPEITVQPLYRIIVLGEVRTPGTYYVTGVEKFSDLLAKAGGETRDANLNKIYVIRGDQKIDINAKEILTKGQSLENIGLEPGDQIYVNRKHWLKRLSVPILISVATLTLIAIQTFR